ncbi:MAG: radical SAM protein [Candidatus Methanoperedens sp.]|nr:radical SAM protein [Candidatus Methanoperedens sp.]
MPLNLTDGIVRVVLGQYASLKPEMTCKPLFRTDTQGTVVFDSASLKTVMVDKNAAETLKVVDGSDISTIAHRLAMISGLPRIMASYMTLRYLSNFQRQGFISLPVEIKAPKPPRSEKKVVFSSPVIVSWEITKACNLKCSHCASMVSEGRELDTDEALALIDHMHKQGVFILSFSGGEPFIRPDFFTLLERAREKGIEIGVTTNGTLLDENIVKRLSSFAPFNVHISIDGIGEVHDYFRNRAGVFESSIRSLKLLQKHKVPCGITTSMTKRNFHDLDNIKEFVKQNNIRSWEIFFAIPVGNLDKSEALDESEFMELARKVGGIRKELTGTRVFVGDSLGYFGKACIRDEDWGGCTAGITHCAIDAYGNVKGCPIQPQELVEGNIRDNSLDKIWLSDSAFRYNRGDIELEGYCSKCQHKRSCRAGCRTSAYHITGNIRENRMCLHYMEMQRE